LQASECFPRSALVRNFTGRGGLFYTQHLRGSRMSQCSGFFSNFVLRDRQSSGRSRPVSVTVSHPSPEWCQFTIVDEKRSARLSIPMTQFFELVTQMDGLLQAEQAG